ncbi:hypothetical protein T07_1884, partial [Trichinella nelsoni]
LNKKIFITQYSVETRQCLTPFKSPSSVVQDKLQLILSEGGGGRHNKASLWSRYKDVIEYTWHHSRSFRHSSSPDSPDFSCYQPRPGSQTGFHQPTSRSPPSLRHDLQS